MKARLVVFALAALLASACRHELRPLPVPVVEIDPARQSFPAGTAVSLANAAPPEWKAVLRSCCHSYEIERSQWTEEFLLALEKELGRRGVAVRDGAGRELRLSLDLVPLEDGGVPLLEVHVTVGGWSAVYPREGRFASLRRALAVAMEELLEDERLRIALATAPGA